MLKHILIGLAIALPLSVPVTANASPGDIGGEPVKAISPITSPGSVFLPNTIDYDNGGSVLTISEPVGVTRTWHHGISPRHRYRRIESGIVRSRVVPFPGCRTSVTRVVNGSGNSVSVYSRSISKC